jgi:gliding motility-associated-like protein
MKYSFNIFKRTHLISIIIPVLFFLCLIPANSQQLIVSKGRGVVYPNFENRLDALVMMYDLKMDHQLDVLLQEDSLNVEWLVYADELLQAGSGTRFLTNQLFVSPVDMTGYKLRISGTVNGSLYNKTMHIWVIDYKKYQLNVKNLIPDLPAASACKELNITIDGDVPVMHYYLAGGQKYSIERDMNLQYKSLEWGNNSWSDKVVNKTVNPVLNVIKLDDPPLADTNFELTDTFFARDLNVPPYSFTSTLYHAIRVITKIKTETSIREEKNEGSRPSMATTLDGSAPLDINFDAISNNATDFVRWDIYYNNELFLNRTDQTHRFTFSKAGTYQVKLKAENAYCNYVDSITVKVSESALYAPNVFSPNGDDVNDEFRFAFKSIVSFQCTIFNRSGKQIYSWTDPLKGWDGTYNGVPVPEGAYFYIATAKGSDNKEYKLKGDINLLRGKKK